MYNVINVQYGDKTATKKDTDSISRYGERILDMNTILDKHQAKWAEWIASSYLERFKDVHQIVDIALKPSLYIKVGEVVVIQQLDRLHLNHRCQVLEVKHNFNSREQNTQVKMVTL